MNIHELYALEIQVHQYKIQKYISRLVDDGFLNTHKSKLIEKT